MTKPEKLGNLIEGFMKLDEEGKDAIGELTQKLANLLVNPDSLPSTQERTPIAGNE